MSFYELLFKICILISNDLFSVSNAEEINGDRYVLMS